VSFDEWHHVAGVLDSEAGELRLFLDGALLRKQTTARRAAEPYAGPLRIGLAAEGNGGFGFDGLIDEVRVSRVARYAAAFAPPYPLPDGEPDTVATWHFSELTGTKAADTTGEHPGTLGKITSAGATPPTWTAAECPLPSR
jgi:hypothetical protein